MTSQGEIGPPTPTQLDDGTTQLTNQHWSQNMKIWIFKLQNANLHVPSARTVLILCVRALPTSTIRLSIASVSSRSGKFDIKNPVFRRGGQLNPRS